MVRIQGFPIKAHQRGEGFMYNIQGIHLISCIDSKFQLLKAILPLVLILALLPFIVKHCVKSFYLSFNILHPLASVSVITPLFQPYEAISIPSPSNILCSVMTVLRQVPFLLSETVLPPLQPILPPSTCSSKYNPSLCPGNLP